MDHMKEALKRHMQMLKSKGHGHADSNMGSTDHQQPSDAESLLNDHDEDDQKDSPDRAPSLDKPEDPTVLDGEALHSNHEHGDPSALSSSDMKHGMTHEDKLAMLEKIASSHHSGRGPTNLHEMAGNKMKSDILSMRKNKK